MSLRSGHHAHLWRSIAAALGALLVVAACGGPSGGPPTPEVNSTAPADQAAGVGVDTDIVVAFSTEMDPSTVENAFSANPTIPCDFSWNGANDEVTCDPQSDLNAGATYTVTIGGSAASADGETLDGDHTFDFTTGTGAAPAVTSITPADGETDVGLNTNIEIAFSQQMDATATQAAFGANPGISCTFLWNAAGDTLTCNPDSNFDASTNYTVTVDTSAKSASGTNLASEEQISFDTGTTVLDACELGASQLGNCVLD